MIENITAMLGGMVLIGGLLLVAVAWAKSKSTAVAKSVDAVTSRITDAFDGGNKRLEALRDAEQLFQYFEENKNSAGQEAIKQAVGEMFSKGVKS